jgi:hypothetical protein
MQLIGGNERAAGSSGRDLVTDYAAALCLAVKRRNTPLGRTSKMTGAFILRQRL